MDRAIENAAGSLGASDMTVLRRGTLNADSAGRAQRRALALSELDEVKMTVLWPRRTMTLPCAVPLNPGQLDPLIT